MNNYHKSKYPTKNDPVISVKCDSKYVIKWTYLAVQKEDAHFNILKPQAAKSVVVSPEWNLLNICLISSIPTAKPDLLHS